MDFSFINQVYQLKIAFVYFIQQITNIIKHLNSKKGI